MEPKIVDEILERLGSKESTGLIGLLGGRREELILCDFIYNSKNHGELYFSEYSAKQQCPEGFGRGFALVACDIETGVYYIPEKERLGAIRIYYDWNNTPGEHTRDNMIAAIKIFNAEQNEIYAQIKSDIEKNKLEARKQTKKGLVNRFADALKDAASFIF